MYTDRLNSLFQTLQATNLEIASYAGCDRSNISRLRSGSRIPKPTGVAAERVAQGLVTWAAQHDMLPVLCSCIGEEDVPAEELPSKVLTWLYQDMDFPVRKRHKPVKIDSRFAGFGDRLSKSMDSCGISSIRLSALAGVDASQISRFRNGVRRPKSSSQPLKKIADILLERSRQEGRLNAFSKMTGISEEVLADRTSEKASACFVSWLLTGNPEG